MRNLNNFLIKRSVDYQKLLDYGFQLKNENYVYKCNIADNQFEVIINISDNEKYSKVIDKLNDSEYSLVDVETATGEFVGKVREQYEEVINNIIQKCTNKDVFSSNQTKEIIKYISEKYADELEFLWEKYDDNAIWRNKQNNKWYGAILTIEESKLGLNSDKIVEVLDLKYQKEDIENIIDNKRIFPGYHMNKKSWITIKLDNTVETKEIIRLIDNSYNLSIGEKNEQSEQLNDWQESLFVSSNSEKELKEAPLGYWEKESYISIIPENGNITLDERIFDRVSNIEGVTVKEKYNITEKEPGKMVLEYEGENYEIGFFPMNFNLPEMYIRGRYYFLESEVEKLKNAKNALTLFMKFGKNAKKSYHLQLKVAYNIMPNLIGLMDESAEKIMPARLVKMIAESKVEPSPIELYTVQAVCGENDEVWLHTHGLCRCGLTELEILKSDKNNYNNHYNLISTFATYLIDKQGEFNPLDNSAYIGLLSDRQPVVVTCKSWTNAIYEYDNLDLGGLKDRESGHNSRYSVIFLYKTEEDEKNKKITKVSDFNDKWADNPIFFISNSETNRMKALAREQFEIVKKQAENKENKILIKIGLPVNPEEEEYEHIWFELLEFENDVFKAKLTQEPYNVDNIHTGDIREYTINDVTDWIIYTPNFSVTPGNSYLII